MIFGQSKIEDFESIARKVQFFVVDFVNIPFYGKEKNEGDTIRSKTGQGHPFLCLCIYILDIKE